MKATLERCTLGTTLQLNSHRPLAEKCPFAVFSFDCLFITKAYKIKMREELEEELVQLKSYFRFQIKKNIKKNLQTPFKSSPILKYVEFMQKTRKFKTTFKKRCF